MLMKQHYRDLKGIFCCYIESNMILKTENTNCSVPKGATSSRPDQWHFGKCELNN